MPERTYGLPCAWHYVRQQDITIRWGRPDGVFSVHRGDQRGGRDNHTLLTTVPVSQAWLDANEVARKASAWAKANPEPLRGERR
ncbi:hypothetical protein OOZ19_04330 [Saccharopolyspora sp. NFXS83]|uniref:hypothetical protein n=1 Tax=Saccharopolyspora sp. NFXS83 TaxID=2993560 RepID=UPI00224A55A2|nr:hypothetical protein [Saccharopolyspora sp. NFXS83]MCX2729456.1 hypothetical protein [Saccharopolyspora sp. NFXS83]